MRATGTRSDVAETEHVQVPATTSHGRQARHVVSPLIAIEGVEQPAVEHRLEHPVQTARGQCASMRRIAVIGPVASGKSTLARHLGPRLGLPVTDLDDVYLGPGGPFPDGEWAAVHRRLLEPERWIIAGDHRAVASE